MASFIVSQHGLFHLSILAMLATTNENAGDSLVSRCPLFPTLPPVAKSKIRPAETHTTQNVLRSFLSFYYYYYYYYYYFREREKERRCVFGCERWDGNQLGHGQEWQS